MTEAQATVYNRITVRLLDMFSHLGSAKLQGWQQHTLMNGVYRELDTMLDELERLSLKDLAYETRVKLLTRHEEA